MQSRNKPRPTSAEAAHIARVAALPCSVCDKAGPSEVHEIKQGAWWLSMSLCADCHRGSFNGLHGQKRIWAVKKMDELDAYAVCVKRMLEAQAPNVELSRAPKQQQPERDACRGASDPTQG